MWALWGRAAIGSADRTGIPAFVTLVKRTAGEENRCQTLFGPSGILQSFPGSSHSNQPSQFVGDLATELFEFGAARLA